MNEHEEDQAVPLREDYTGLARCLGCGYRLKGIDSSRCPECGREFDRHDPMTMNVPGFKRRAMPPPTFGEQMITSAFFAMIITSAGFHLNWVVALIGVVTWIALIRRGWRRRRNALTDKTPEGPRWRVAITVMLLLTVVLSQRYGSCAHGYYAGLGPIGFFYSPWGSPPCRDFFGTRAQLSSKLYFVSRKTRRSF